jgi:hypothetical protein
VASIRRIRCPSRVSSLIQMQITVATGSLRHCRVMVAFAESSSDLLNVRLLNVRLLKVRLLKVRLLKVRLLKVRAHGPACDRDYLSIYTFS